MTQPTRAIRRILTPCLGVLLVLSFASCGGGTGGGPGPDGPGQGLVLVSFLEGGVDNIPLNRMLHFEFSEAVDPTTISAASIQIREGPTFGLPVQGTLRAEGARVYFEPQLPSLCDLSDSAFQPNTTYRVTILGYPEQWMIRNTQGQALPQTLTAEFTTLGESAPSLFDDQIPATLPQVVATTPAHSDAAVTVESANVVVLDMSENLDPCSVSPTTVRLHMYELGDINEFESGAPSGNESGFVPWADQAPGDPYTWGANGVAVVPPQRIPSDIVLDQSFESTQIRIVPKFGKFPENCLLVVELTPGIRDFGGYPLERLVMSFTTENLPEREDVYLLENEGETPYLQGSTTADVNTTRSPSRAQGFVLISGDGDNGTQMTDPSSPEVPPDCTVPRGVNDGITDEFKPTMDTVLDTGDTLNTCPNSVDGSFAVIWEFKKFTIPSGVTVDIVGVNPALILVNGLVTIESGGTLNLAGSRGTNGTSTSTYGAGRPGGANGGNAVAGGGDGGDSLQALENEGGSFPIPIPYVDSMDSYGDDGWEGYGSPAYTTDPQGGHGGGEGNAATWHGALNPPTGPYEATGIGAGGGGGGHGTTGGTGGVNVAPSGNSPLSAPARGGGGQPYETTDVEMRLPSAGSGGGAGGYMAFPSYTNSTAYWSASATGGGGGGGGGFVDITSSFDIRILGTISASGGGGGRGGGSYFCDTGGGGGGGGGSGGGVRLLTTASIDVTGGTITTAGGLGGAAGAGPTCPQGTAGQPNNGGFGASGRIVLEDSDGVITGQNSATLVPPEGAEGFYRSRFDASRFLGGGRLTRAVTDLFLVGTIDPLFQDPALPPGNDFVSGIPSEAAADLGITQIFVEAQGFQMLPDGEPDPASGTGWRTVGYFTNSGQPTLPRWNLGQIVGPLRSPDNTEAWGITNLNGCEYIQVRLSFELGPFAGIEDAGPFIDNWTIRFRHDQ